MPIAPVNDSPTYETEDDLPEGVVQPGRFPDHAAKYAGDPIDDAKQKELDDRNAYEAWKASRVDPNPQGEKELADLKAYREWEANKNSNIPVNPAGSNYPPPANETAGSAPYNPQS